MVKQIFYLYAQGYGKTNIARILNIHVSQVGITATTGEGLTDFGRGEGISVFCILTVE